MKHGPKRTGPYRLATASAATITLVLNWLTELQRVTRRRVICTSSKDWTDRPFDPYQFRNNPSSSRKRGQAGSSSSIR